MDADVLIIGAGAAGLAAGMRLRDAANRVIILEARDRSGGRMHTDYAFANFPLERGAEFIHGANAVTHELVRQAGLSEIPVDRMGRLRWGAPAQAIAALPHHERSLIENLHLVYDSLKDAELPEDKSLSAYLSTCGYDGKDAQIAADVLFAQTCCAAVTTLSCHDLQRETRVDHSGGMERGGESRIREGYGALVAWMARDLDIRLNHPVTRIERTAQGVTITASGAAYTARACIVTIPAAVLNAGINTGALVFDPPLSESKRSAIAVLRMEPATKFVYRFRRHLWDAELTYMAGTGVVPRWWTPAYGRENADPVITGYATAEYARRAERVSPLEQTPEGMADHALGALGDLLGIPYHALQAELVEREIVEWGKDSWALGGYAHVPPGMADARPALAAAEPGGLYFAGEATAYDTNPQTVHGAIESGWRAANEALTLL